MRPCACSRRAERRRSGALSTRAPAPSTVTRPSCRRDRKSTRLNSSHIQISYAVFCLKKITVHHMLLERDVIMGSFFVDVEGVQRRTMSAAYPAVRRAMTSHLDIDDESVAFAFVKLRQAGERFQAELQPSGYLVGAGFTVADLTLAALLSPPVAP